MKGLVRSHVTALRCNTRFARCNIVFVPEANLGLEGSHLAHMLREYREVYTVQYKAGRPGMITTNQSKARSLLYVVSYAIYNASHRR
jgi:hypothetical protein